MPSFADVYNNAPAPSVHSTRYPLKSSHPTSTDHIPADAKPLDTRRMSSSKVGLGRTRGTERSSKPEEAPVGSEFAQRTQVTSGMSPTTTAIPSTSGTSGTSGTSDGSASPTSGKKSGVFGSWEKRASSASPRLSDENVVSESAISEDQPKPVESGERRGSITNFFKKVF